MTTKSLTADQELDREYRAILKEERKYRAIKVHPLSAKDTQRLRWALRCLIELETSGDAPLHDWILPELGKILKHIKPLK